VPNEFHQSCLLEDRQKIKAHQETGKNCLRKPEKEEDILGTREFRHLKRAPLFSQSSPKK
jgi:hypothetical protein